MYNRAMSTTNDTIKRARFAAFALLALVCSSADATMYSCIDSNGAKVLKNSPCEPGQKQKTIERIVITSSRTKIDSTGEVQRYESATPQEDRPTRALTPVELRAQRCEEMYYNATNSNSLGVNRDPAARMWLQLGCKGHCDELYSIVSDTSHLGTGHLRDIASQLYSACQ